MKTFCPICLKIEELKEHKNTAGEISYLCQEREGEVPMEYLDKWREFPPVVFSVVGDRGHGKTVYLHALLLQLQQLVRDRVWPEFNYTPIPDMGMQAAFEKTLGLRQGSLPESSQSVFPDPQILRIRGMPVFGNYHLLLYDTSGEVLTKSLVRKTAGGYLLRSKLLVWLISLDDVENPTDLQQHLANYRTYVRRSTGQLKRQGVLFTLTKCDKWLERSGTPAKIKQFIQGDDTQLDTSKLRELNELSDEIEQWLKDTGYNGFLQDAYDTFRHVRFSVNSALGTDPTAADGSDRSSGPELTVVPKGVLAPLLWDLMLNRPRTTVHADGNVTLYFDLAKAIEMAPPGAQIRLSPGDHHCHQPLRVRSGLQICGSQGKGSVPRSRVFCHGDGGIVFEGNGDTFHMVDLSVFFVGSGSSHVCEIQSGTADFSRCHFYGGRSSNQEESIGGGLAFSMGSKGTLKECMCSKNGGDGIIVAEKAVVCASHCKFSYNSGYGAYLGQKAKWSGQGNDYDGNAKGPSNRRIR